jgi:hypothetical protein
MWRLVAVALLALPLGSSVALADWRVSGLFSRVRRIFELEKS